MCYFVAVGATTEGWRLGVWLEDRLGEQVEAGAASTALSAAFPGHDSVRTVTCRGCSCDLLLAGDDALRLRPAFRLALAFLARRLERVRLFIASSSGQGPSPQAPMSLTLEQLLCLQTAVPTGVLVEIVARASAESPGA